MSKVRTRPDKESRQEARRKRTHACLRCGHKWIGHTMREDLAPKVCVKCRSPYWNTPRSGKFQYEKCPTCGRSYRIRKDRIVKLQDGNEE